jgi:hypothetical protein
MADQLSVKQYLDLLVSDTHTPCQLTSLATFLKPRPHLCFIYLSLMAKKALTDS